jgi:SdrD B-like protein
VWGVLLVRLWMRTAMIRLAALATTVVLAAALPATPAMAEASAHLRVTATFDKVWYLRDNTVHATVTMVNDGQLAASGIRGSAAHNLELITGWGDLGTDPGAVIEPGATLVVELTARIPTSSEMGVYFNGSIVYSTGTGYASENFSLSAWIVEGFGDFGGVIFGDANVNGVQDPGENGLVGVTLDISGPQTGMVFKTQTDAKGRFSFAGIPVGTYFISYNTVPDRWVIVGVSGSPFDTVIIDTSPSHSDVRIPATRQLQERLQASIFFQHDTYQAGETAHLSVVLNNIGTTAITGLTATCYPGVGEPRLRGGPGWGPLAEGGPGVTVPAGQATIVTVTEPVPDSGPRYGFVAAYCGFDAPGYPRDATVTAEARAKVPGVSGSGRARIFNDLNDNSYPDDGEAVAGLTVALTDPDSGAVVAQAVTDESGAFAVNDLPATLYDVRFDGPWKPHAGIIYGYQLPVVADSSAGETSLRVAPDSAPDNRRPNLRASAEFDKPEFASDETVRVRLTVTNFGDVAAVGVHVNRTRDLGFSLLSMGDLDPYKPGVRIEAGATQVFEFEGPMWKPPGAVVFTGWVEAAGYDVNFANNRFGAVAPVIATRGTYAGVLYGDQDNDGVMDPGEEFGRTPIDLHGGVPFGQYRQSTNEHGEFTFSDIPTGRYGANFYVPDGWLVTSAEVVVKAGEQPKVEVRAVRPDNSLISAIAFTKNTYAAGETAHLTITLTNRGQQDLTGVKAFCSGPGNGNEIYSNGPGWGDVGTDDGPGVVVRAGETATFDVWDVIPQGAFAYGYVIVECDFGAPLENAGSSSALATAKVPGGIGNAGGLLLYDRNSDHRDDGDGVPDTKLVLRDGATGQVVARAVTDAQGHFMFNEVPAGRYDVLVVGPWKSVECWCPGVFAGQTVDHFQVRVVPGAVQPDPDAQQDEPSPIPQPAIVAATLLAATGMDLIDLLTGALSLLALGVGMALVRRRRQPKV